MRIVILHIFAVGPPKNFVKSTTEIVFAYGYDRQRVVSVTTYAEVV
jgi:hypothetical protein